jgi:signal transduction histidine kinase
VHLDVPETLAVPAAPEALFRRAVAWARSEHRALLLLAAIGLGLAYAGGALLPFWFLTSPASGAAFFPSAGLTLAVLALTSRRYWPLWLAAVAVAELAVDLSHGQSIAMAAGFALANTIEPFIGASLFTTYATRRSPLRRHIVGFVGGAVIIGPMVGASTAAFVVASTSPEINWASTMGKWWLGDGIGVLIVGSAIIAWSRRAPFDARCSGLEMAAVAFVATAVTLLPAVLWEHPLLYAVLPVLLWGALRGGLRAVTLGGLGVAFAADWATVTGRTGELIMFGTVDEGLVFVQIFLASTLLAALVLAVEVADRRQSEHRAFEADLERRHAEDLAAEAVQAERRRIAQETHDIIGHALNVILLQAGAARRVLHSDEQSAMALLTSVEEVGRSAFGDLDVALAIVDAGAAPPPRGVADLPDLVHELAAGGLAVDLRISGDRPYLSALVDRSVYRIVQEALTNVVKHATYAATTVTVTYEADHVALAVVDDGGPQRASSSHRLGPARGLLGMRERVNLLSGTLTAGPMEAGGFAVRAELPLHGARP